MSNYSYKTLGNAEVHRSAKLALTVGPAQFESGKENIHIDVRRLRREEHAANTCSDFIVSTGGSSQKHVESLSCCDSSGISIQLSLG